MHIQIFGRGFDIPPKREKINEINDNDIEIFRDHLQERTINRALEKIRRFRYLRIETLNNKNLNLIQLNELHDTLLGLLTVLNDNKEARNADEELKERLDIFEERTELIEQQIENLEHDISN
ncbi:MAG: hypothetical protein AABX19_01525 [Nanoarchaeota archaeon]